MDLDDHEIGSEEKLRAHEKGYLHRAFSVFIYQGDRMLIQQRNPEKYHSGGLWANACCSHPRAGESLTEAIHRRLQEEAGFDCELAELFSFTYRTVFTNGLTEYEFDHVFLGSYDGEVKMNPEPGESVLPRTANGLLRTANGLWARQTDYGHGKRRIMHGNGIQVCQFLHNCWTNWDDCGIPYVL